MTDVTAIITCMTDAERPFVADAIRSVQRQTVRTDITLCVMEDNDWIGEILASVEPGVEVLRLKGGWVGTVRNRAMERVRTEYVAFLDGDDLWEPDKTAKQLGFLASHPRLAVIGTKHVLIRTEGTPYFFGFAKEIPMPSSWFGRTAWFLENPFDDIAMGEDQPLWKLLRDTEQCGIMDDFLIRYRVRDVSLSSQAPSKQRKAAYARRSRIFGLRPVFLGTSYAVNIGLRVRKRVLSSAT